MYIRSRSIKANDRYEPPGALYSLMGKKVLVYWSDNIPPGIPFIKAVQHATRLSIWPRTLRRRAVVGEILTVFTKKMKYQKTKKNPINCRERLRGVGRGDIGRQSRRGKKRGKGTNRRGEGGTRACYVFAPGSELLLRGTILNRTYGTRKKLDVSLFLLL